MSDLKSAFYKYLAQTSQSPDGLEVTRGSGIYLYDQEGRAYVDGISGIAVSSLGHDHPDLINAIRNQLDYHLHTMVYGEHIQRVQVRFAEKLSEHLPANLNCTYFTNSGAEAVEGALKLAKKYTRRYRIISCRHCYHGSTAGAESLRSDQAHKASILPLVPGISHIGFNSFDDIHTITEQTAAIIIEPIQGEAGVIEPVHGYLKAIQNRCRETGTLLIFDEIQTGMGRTGKLWAFEREGVIPDILLLGKAFGGGLPLGAFIADQKIMAVLSENPALGHLTTFGGHPLSCAAGMEALRVITEGRLFEKTLFTEQLIRSGLGKHPLIREIRGSGLMLALGLKNHSLVLPAIQACRKEGILLDWFLFNPKSIRLYLPLIITEAETHMVCEKIRHALDSLS